MEGQVINRALKKLIQDNDLPDVVFHSFRHASITYKLKWNGGDMKSVQATQDTPEWIWLPMFTAI